jgi:hypothetical protein
MGRNTNCGPTNPRDSSRPQRKCQTKKNSTALVANVIHKIPNPQNNNWMREKKQKKTTPNFSSLQTGYHTRAPARLAAEPLAAGLPPPRGKPLPLLPLLSPSLPLPGHGAPRPPRSGRVRRRPGRPRPGSAAPASARPRRARARLAGPRPGPAAPASAPAMAPSPRPRPPPPRARPPGPVPAVPPRPRPPSSRPRLRRPGPGRAPASPRPCSVLARPPRRALLAS